MLAEVHGEAQEAMAKALAAFESNLAVVRTGRANPQMLHRVVVEAYGTPMPLNQVSTISAPDSRTLVVQPWDKSQLNAITRAIMQSDLNLTPTDNGEVVIINIPALTEERRKDMVKQARHIAEEARIAVRNGRRGAMDMLKELLKESEISEDEQRRAQDKVQQLTDEFVGKIDKVLADKEKEILQ
jgi:ribosome recycling factor